MCMITKMIRPRKFVGVNGAKIIMMTMIQRWLENKADGCNGAKIFSYHGG